MVFSREAPEYRPRIKRLAAPVVRHARQKSLGSLSSPLMGGDDCKARKYYGSFPQSILLYARPKPNVHPTQKSVELMEYLVRTYAREGETVLDFTMGSGTTGVACVKAKRNFIGIEKDPHWFAVSQQRVAAAEPKWDQPGLGLGVEDEFIDVEDAVKILEEIDPALYAAMEANDGTEPSEEDEAIDEVFGC